MQNLVEYYLYSYGILVAFSDELHQMYTENRSPKITDVGIDTAGVVTGILLSSIVYIVLKTIYNVIREQILKRKGMRV